MENKITAFFWFNHDLKEVINYYQDIFNREAQMNFEEVAYHLVSDAPGQRVELATVRLFGNTYHFMAAQGPFVFNESVSLMRLIIIGRHLPKRAKRATVAGVRTNTACLGR